VAYHASASDGVRGGKGGSTKRPDITILVAVVKSLVLGKKRKERKSQLEI